MRKISRFQWAAVLTLATAAATAPGGSAQEAQDSFAGIWTAQRHFEPALTGDFLIEERNGSLTASIGARLVDVSLTGKDVNADFGDDGRFEGRFDARKTRIEGRWLQPPARSNGTAYASPVMLTKTAAGQWRGEVVAFNDDMTLVLVARDGAGGQSVELKNPQRNLGLFLQGERLERKGDNVDFVGRFRGRGEEQVFAKGVYQPGDDVLSLYFSSAGGTFDFGRADESSLLYRRRPAGASYEYRAPPQLGDGWRTASVDDVGLSETKLAGLVQHIVDMPLDGVDALAIHGVLVARHGKLVFEEYFNGYNRSTPHDTRSASKSVAATLVGAAIEAGRPVSLSTPVYKTMLGETPADLDPRKADMALRDLLIMAPGWDCDDSNGDSPGSEDVMQSQEGEPDWRRYTLALPMARTPGETSIYCSASANMVGGVLERATGEPLPLLFQDLLARPLGVARYHINLDPAGSAYMGGGMYWLPRDFMKLGQLMIDDGVWNGKRILPRGWAAEAGGRQTKIGDRDYGYLWWSETYPYKDGTVQAFFAAGNGGQIVMGVPALDLVIAIYGGNYSHRMTFYAQRTLVPEYILPAVMD